MPHRQKGTSRRGGLLMEVSTQRDLTFLWEISTHGGHVLERGWQPTYEAANKAARQKFSDYAAGGE